MSDWDREEDRELWRAAQYSHIYGQEAGQNYLAWSRAWPVILILILVCVAFPVLLIIPLGLLVIWGGVSAYSRTRDTRQAQIKYQAQQAAVERHQAAIDRLVHNLQIALKSGNDAAVGEVCKSLAREDAFGTAIPYLQVALGDIDPCQRLCAIRGLRWGTRFVNYDGSVKMPSFLLWGVLADLKDTPQLRVAAAIALGNGGFIDAYGSLFRCASDPDPEVRAACCHALGQLMLRLRGDAQLRTVLVTEITQAAREEGFNTVLSALRDVHVRVRQEAAQALGQFRDPRALRPLQELILDKSQPEAIRNAAYEAVETIKKNPS